MFDELAPLMINTNRHTHALSQLENERQQNVNDC